MKLKPLIPDGTAATRIGNLQKVLGIQFLAKGSSIRPDKMILLGDGTPDDVVVAILSHLFDGEDTALLVKPNDYRNLAALRDVAYYVRETSQNVSTYIFVVDQENLTLLRLFQRAERTLRGLGISIEPRSTNARTGRVGIYRCHVGPRDFTLVIVVNGHDLIHCPQHTIEDHLVVAAGNLATNLNAKDVWRRLDDDDQNEILRRLLTPTTAAQALPQHLSAWSSIHVFT